MIITHRGRNTGQRENTISAFDKAIEMGAQGIECDLRLTLDNKIIVHHNRKIMIDKKKIAVSNILFKDIVFYKKQLHEVLLLDELFSYITKYEHIQFFLEVKSSSQILVESIIKRIADKDLWPRVHIIGFSFFIGTALRLQSKYPKLKVCQLVNIPLYSYIRKPAKSYGVFLGWFDEFFASERLFRKLISVGRLTKLREFYERNGFKVMGAVINRETGFRYFQEAGIADIVTDNVDLAANYFKDR